MYISAKEGNIYKFLSWLGLFFFFVIMLSHLVTNFISQFKMN